MAPETAYDVICVGSATEDVFVDIPDTKIVRFEDREQECAYLALEYGGKIRARDVLIDTGGGATNTAVTFSTMGLRCGIVTKVGLDGPGDRVRQSMTSHGVDGFGIVADPTHRTGYSVIITGFTGDRTILVYRGASAYLRREDVDWGRLAQTSWIYMNSLAGDSAGLFAEVARFCRDRGIDLAINPGTEQRRLGMEGLREVLPAVSLLACNRSEAYEMTGVEPDRGPEDEKDMLEMFLEAGCRRAIITYGKDGSEGMDAEGHYKVPCMPGVVVSTVGAGDAYASACVVGLQRGLSLENAMWVGAANATSVVGVLGAKNGILTWEQALLRSRVSGCDGVDQTTD